MTLDKLRKFAKKVDFLHIAKECKDTTEALEYMKENPLDVIFTEVSMPPGKPNGIEFIESLPIHPLVVFVSAVRRQTNSHRFDGASFVEALGKVASERTADRRVKHITSNDMMDIDGLWLVDVRVWKTRRGSMP